jgi:tetratricopeptide (TPR) repeat protein
MRREDVPATIGLTERALELLPDRHELRPRLLSNLGRSHCESGDFEEAIRAFESGLTAARDTGDRGSAALIEAQLAAVGTMRGSRMEEGFQVIRSRTQELEGLGDEEALADALFLLGQHLIWVEEDPTEILEEGARIANELGNRRLESACIGWRCVDVFWNDGDVDEGLGLCARLLDRPNVGREASRMLILGGNFKRMAGREDEGLADVAEGTAQLMELGRTVDAHAFAMGSACVSILGGRYAQAEQEAVPAYEALKAYGEVGYFSTLAGIVGVATGGQGRYDEAERFADEASAIGAEDDASTQIYWRLAAARVRAARGEHDQARALIDEAQAFLHPRRLFDIALSNASAAEVHMAAGRTDEARQCVEHALTARRKKGIVIGEARMQELLAGVS